MREPRFWWREGSLLGQALAPLGALYGAVTARRMMREGVRPGVPVICIGNFQLGGSGKTPTAMAVVNLLREMGETPVVLSRGYGGRAPGPVRVDPLHHSAAEVGDEPLLLAQVAPVIVARDRVAGAAMACAAGASVLVMDDGLQNPTLHKDAVIAVIDGGRGIGNGAVFPAGPLRAPLAAQLACTDALVVIGAGQGGTSVARQMRARHAPVFHAWFDPAPSSLAMLRGRQVLAFAGIGDPARFFATLRAHGIDVVESQSFPDHHAFSAAEVEVLRHRAHARGLIAVTTAKDRVRLSSDPQLRPLADGIAAFDVRLAFAAADELRQFLRARLDLARGTAAPFTASV